MNEAITWPDKSDQSRIFQSRKFALLLAIASMVMMFAAFTSAYVVRKSAGNWLEFRLPDLFFVSTVFLVVSSLTAEAARKAFARRQTMALKGWLLATLGLGLVFIGLQYMGWLALVEIGIPLNGNPSGSFVYVISGFHAMHVLGGLAAWMLTLNGTMRGRGFTPRRKLYLDLSATYWHFVDALWVYLLIFLILQ
ncbi:MAG: cytochrome c oxidase subunit 3 [Saprospiraceae bacterium]|nr:cytochrome c oxidase subunit 3 [Saprospiraceae bacterium]